MRLRLDGRRHVVSGDHLVSVAFEETTEGFSIQSCSLSALRRNQAEQTLTDCLEHSSQGTTKPAADAIHNILVGADAESLVVAESWLGTLDTSLRWFKRSGRGFVSDEGRLIRISGDGGAAQVLVSGRYALVITGLSKILLIENGSSSLSVRAARQLEVDPRVLRWSSEFVYVTSGGLFVNPAFQLLSPSTLETIVTYPLSDRAVSLAEVGERLAVTVRNGFHVLTPPCGN